MKYFPTTLSGLILVFHSLLLVIIFQLLTVHTASANRHDYCVIGAGPGGLQLGYFLKKAGRDYILFERSNVSANFYTLYPRHRTLISINKRHTGQTNKEYNLRHDWNSLLSDDETLLFRHYSNKMFPNADVYLDYARDYQQKLGINVQFNTDIRNIQTVKNKSLPDGHYFTMDDQNNNQYICRTLVVATGMWKPFIPNMPGIELAEGYETVSIDPADYEGKSVLILGRGNAAFETADAIYGATNLIHMVGRSRVRLSWATHYVGDLRAVNNGLLDTYQLKSLDAALETLSEDLGIARDGDKFRMGSNAGNNTVDLEESDNSPFRDPYDKIIRCLGFTFDTSIFTNSTMPKKGKSRGKKFPAIKHNYESTRVPGMFFAGTNTHSLDHRKSAGGFIHGYRYTARALHHILENRYEGVTWPSITHPVTQLMNTLLRRMNEASGIYQMFGVLGDIVVFRNNKMQFEYFEEFPINLLHEFPAITGHPADTVIALVMEYGTNFSGPGNDVFRIDRATSEPSEAHTSNFLHPVLYYYEALPTKAQMSSRKRHEALPRPLRKHHIVEDFLAFWNAPMSHILPLRRFLEDVLRTDMRNFFSDYCFKAAMTHMTTPLTCQHNFLKGHGNFGTMGLRLLGNFI